MGGMINIASLADREGLVSARYRSHQFIPGLARRGIALEAITVPPSFSGRLALFRRLGAFDAVILHRRLFNLPNFFFLRFFARKLILDVDDAVFLRDSHHDAAPSPTRTIRFRRTVKAADLVVAGNAYISAEVKKFNERCAIVPTVVDLARYPSAREHKKERIFKAVWIGGRSTLGYLESILPSLKPLTRSLPNFRLVVIADVFPENPPVPMKRILWSETTEAENLLRSDTGLMPLPDDAWTRGKCGLKLIQYGAAGLPALFSPVGVNPSIALDGITGLAVPAPGDWSRAIERIAADHALRTRMGEAARKRIEEFYSVGAWTDRMAEMLQALTEGGKRERKRGKK